MIVYLNDRFVPREEARIDPFDRGFVFGDGVYEGLRSFAAAGKPRRIIGLQRHVQRMQQGLDEASIPFDASLLGPVTDRLLDANGLSEAFVYWQVTRGVPNPGDPVRGRVPASRLTPTVFAYCTPQPSLTSITTPPTKKARTCRDVRWELGHMKSISLMGNVLSALYAAESGCDEAILIRDTPGAAEGGLVGEGLATNVVLALPAAGGGTELVTPSLESVPILAGVTRSVLLGVCPEIVARPVMASDLARAIELMFIGTTTLVTSIVELDGRRIGEGGPGPEARRLLGALLEAVLAGRDDAATPRVRAGVGGVATGRTPFAGAT